MSFKLIAIGNILMKDDAIGIKVAEQMEDELSSIGVEVIYGETNLQHIMGNIEKEDYIIILDAAYYGKNIGEITTVSIDKFISNKVESSQHNYNFLDLVKLYYPNIKGVIYGIEVNKVEFGIGLDCILQKKLKLISQNILNEIKKIVN